MISVISTQKAQQEGDEDDALELDALAEDHHLLHEQVVVLKVEVAQHHQDEEQQNYEEHIHQAHGLPSKAAPSMTRPEPMLQPSGRSAQALAACRSAHTARRTSWVYWRNT